MVAIMDEVLSTKDFYDHEVRLSIIETLISNVDRRLDYVDKRFDQVDKRFDQLESRMNSQFNKIIHAIGALALTTIGSLITLILSAN